jgi:hypothetical protein
MRRWPRDYKLKSMQRTKANCGDALCATRSSTLRHSSSFMYTATLRAMSHRLQAHLRSQKPQSHQHMQLVCCMRLKHQSLLHHPLRHLLICPLLRQRLDREELMPSLPTLKIPSVRISNRNHALHCSIPIVAYNTIQLADDQSHWSMMQCTVQ